MIRKGAIWDETEVILANSHKDGDKGNVFKYNI